MYDENDELPYPFRGAQEWSHWYDFLGNKFSPGDHVAYVVSGANPSLGFGEVLRINRVDSQGKPFKLNPGFMKAEFHVNGLSASVTLSPIDYSRNGAYRRSLKTKQGKPRAVTIRDTQNKIVRVHDTYMDKFKALEEHLVNVEVERILEQHGNGNTTETEVTHEQASED